MRSKLLPVAQVSRLAWFQLQFKDADDHQAAQRLRTRLVNYLRGSHLLPIASEKEVGVIAHRRPIGPLDRALVLAWLTKQPEGDRMHDRLERPSAKPMQPPTVVRMLGARRRRGG